MSTFSIQIYTRTQDFPSQWDVLAAQNIFLSRAYLKILEDSRPENMRCFFIGVFESNTLKAIALSQFLNLSSIASFGDRDSCIKTRVREVVFKNFSSRVLFLGNNMLTGQNALALADGVRLEDVADALQQAATQLAKTHKLAPHLTVWKDFPQTDAALLQPLESHGYFQFSTQPNMVFAFRPEWNSFDDYLESLHKKYRDQYKRARKKAEGITKRKMSLPEIQQQQSRIQELYRTVANGAPFNTFYLPEGHFAQFKRQLGDNFLFYGYFDGEKLVGFSTLIINGQDIDTYFLGYDAQYQRDKMLYLNMLYDMTAWSINQGYRRIIFARTALEIKSSVGAVPIAMYGFMKHRNAIANRSLPKLFQMFEPPSDWQQRHPLKEN